jgi:hypothetical protein
MNSPTPSVPKEIYAMPSEYIKMQWLHHLLIKELETSANDCEARGAASEIDEIEIEELLRDASQANLEDAANAERSMEVRDVLDEELIDKALHGGRTEKIRDVLFAFFAAQIKEKNWVLTSRMPREGRQKAFDELIARLKIERMYASRIWRQYQDNRGVKSTIKIAESEDDLFKGFSEITDRSNIAREAIAATEKLFDFDDDDDAWQEIIFKSILNSPLLPPLINDRVADLNRAFAQLLQKTTTTTLSKKMLAFENHQQQADGIFANEVCIPKFPNQPVRVTGNLLRRWFLALALSINEIWSNAVDVDLLVSGTSSRQDAILSP